MTLSIKETGTLYKCGACKFRTVAVLHNGMVLVRAGKQTAMGPTLSVSCYGCGHWNHISVLEETPKTV